MGLIILLLTVPRCSWCANTAIYWWQWERGCCCWSSTVYLQTSCQAHIVQHQVCSRNCSKNRQRSVSAMVFPSSLFFLLKAAFNKCDFSQHALEQKSSLPRYPRSDGNVSDSEVGNWWNGSRLNPVETHTARYATENITVSQRPQSELILLFRNALQVQVAGVLELSEYGATDIICTRSDWAHLKALGTMVYNFPPTRQTADARCPPAALLAGGKPF